MNYQPKVLVGMPTYGSMSPKAVYSLWNLLYHSLDYLQGLIMVFDSYIDTARNSLAKIAADDETITHLYQQDQDMDVPSQGLLRLLTHNVPVTGGWYCDKSPEHKPTAWNWTPEFERLQDWQSGLQKVGGIPAGCMLVEAWVFREMRKMYNDENWFLITEKGEDVYFSERLKEMNIDSYLDNDLKCGHVMETTATFDDFQKAQKSCLILA